ncbi:MAG: metallophosphoesterase [Candidatus Omnitrophica bacterium]|nr:metallophosphoesterase [Candidatus Omnitrophota bacterium]
MTTLFVIALLLVVWSFVVEPRWLRIRKVPIRLKTPLKRPVTVLHLSDSHFPLHLKTLRRFFRTVSGLKPDFIFLTGDLIENNDGIEECAEAVSQLRAPGGVYAVLGNHDHYDYTGKEIVGFLLTAVGRYVTPQKKNDVERLKKRLQESGCRVLVNENVTLLTEGEEISLIGLDDPVTRKADIERAFQNLNGAAARILLTHTIDVLPRLNGHRVDLALGGHTHGGQVALPFLGPLPLYSHSKMGRKFIAGLNHYRDTVTYTSRGVGEGRFFSFRLFCRPEAVWYEIS